MGLFFSLEVFCVALKVPNHCSIDFCIKKGILVKEQEFSWLLSLIVTGIHIYIYIYLLQFPEGNLSDLAMGHRQWSYCHHQKPVEGLSGGLGAMRGPWAQCAAPGRAELQ